MFVPDYRNMAAVMANRKPERLPLYEHIIAPEVMEKALNVRFADLEMSARQAEVDEFFRHTCDFFRRMTYDTVSYEVLITDILPDHGALMGGRPGPIQSRADLDAYPWDALPERYWATAGPRFDALGRNLPEGMKALGGVGNGVFEISEDLVGYEYLSYMLVDDPDLFAEIYRRIGDLMTTLWDEFLARYAKDFVACRFGDDLGFKSGLLMAPDVLRMHIFPQYKRLVERIHAAGRPFLWHSCGCIFEVMENALALGVDAKHSNEDSIAPFDAWIDRYGARIALLGGIDVDWLCRHAPETIFEMVVDAGRRFRKKARGFALGSGNSIPDYVPVENYLAMVRAAQQLRKEEQ